LLAAFHACFAWGQVWAQRRGVAGWLWVLFAVLNWETWEFIRAELFPRLRRHSGAATPLSRRSGFSRSL